MPVATRLIGVTKPSTLVVPRVAAPDAVPQVTEVGAAGGTKVKVGLLAVMVKLALVISKKILSAASTLIRAVVVATEGIVNASEPSLGVLAEITVGYVLPPSVDKEIFTLAQLIGAVLVPATFHVIVCMEPPAQDSPPLGAVTRNGAVPPTFTVKTVAVWHPPAPLEATPPPAALLSRTVSLNFMALETGDKVSPFKPPIADGGFAGYPANITATSGKVLLPLVFGILDLNNGTLLPAAALAPAFQVVLPVPEKSHCSQQ